MGPVATLVLAFVAVSLLAKLLRERVEFFLHSNAKYRFVNALASYIHYGDDLGVDAALTLDNPTAEVLRRRQEGQRYLQGRLGEKAGAECKGPALARSLVDCRFALAKVCMPLLRELEFPAAGRNFLSAVTNGNGTAGSGKGDDEGAAGMLAAVGEDGRARPFVGNDAVHTLGVRSFYAPVQAEIGRRMSLEEHSRKDGEEAMLRFAPLAMNGALERNVGLVKRLTGMDTVRSTLMHMKLFDQ